MNMKRSHTEKQNERPRTNAEMIAVPTAMRVSFLNDDDYQAP
jgi:hypothetical protein